MSRRWILVVVAVAGMYFMFGGRDVALSYRFATVEKGPIASMVSASGTLRAVVTVDVGTQVSGQISELSADYNTVVKAGQIIARIDSAPFDAKVMQSEAELAVAKANVSIQLATLAELKADIRGARAALAETNKDMKRKRTLVRRKVVSASQVDTAVAEHTQASARVAAAKAKMLRQGAQIEHARASVRQKEAALRQRMLDLEHTIIRSPVDGVVISRSVDTGQTVAASLQAPILYTIAQDLSSMQVEVSVDEADIGRIAESQRTVFTVDSYPGEEFPGEVKQIRKAPIEVSNVVTYVVVVTAENPGLRLLPGMTANVSIIVSRRANAIKVANGALRYRPAGAAAPSQSGPRRSGRARGRARVERSIKRLTRRLGLNPQQQADLRAIFSELGPKIRQLAQGGVERSEIRALIRQTRLRNQPRIAALLNEEQRRKFKAMIASRVGNPIRRGRLWVLDGDGKPKPVNVSFGITDGAVTEIVRGKIEPGQEVIIGERRDTGRQSSSRFRFGF